MYLILPVVSYDYETRALNLGELHMQKVLANKVLSVESTRRRQLKKVIQHFCGVIDRYIVRPPTYTRGMQRSRVRSSAMWTGGNSAL